MKFFKVPFHKKKAPQVKPNLPAVITRISGICPACKNMTTFELKIDQGNVNVYCTSCQKLVLFINKNIPKPFDDIARLREGEPEKFDEIFKSEFK